MDDDSEIFQMEEHLKYFLSYFKSFHKNIKFTSKKETTNKLYFLDFEILQDRN